MSKLFLTLAALSAFLGVVMGAFGAHALRPLLSPEMLDVYKTAVNYQMWHALGLGLLALIPQSMSASPLLRWSGYLMFAGIVLFSGSLYGLAVFKVKWLGMVTPFGGMAFLLAWLLLGVFAQKTRNV
ncbi:MAG: DUF423 domain-containing protein [Gammaproteobacteria bacterium]